MRLQLYTWTNFADYFQVKIFRLIKSKLQTFVWVVPFLLLMQVADAQVSGTVFRDFNANGVKNNGTTFNEPFVAGVTVNAYDANGSVATTTTDVNGAYAFSGLTLPVRIEFTNYLSGDYSAPWGSGSNTSVQFYSAATSSANFGVNYPSDYCHTENPFVGVNVYRNGDPAAALVASKNAFYTFGYNSSGNAPNNIGAVTGQIGATYGQAYQKQTKFSFEAAYVKRHTGFGPLGIGGIYKIDLTNPAAPVAANWISINDPAGLNINVGSVTRVQSSTDINGISSDPTVTSFDADAYLKVGTTGIGDIEFDEAGTTLWLVNLFDRKLYGIKNVNPATSPTAADVLGGYAVTLPAGNSCNGTLRPFALRPYRGLIYVGAVCDATGAGATRADLDAYVLSFNPANPGAGFSVVTTVPLDNAFKIYNGSTLDEHWDIWDVTYVDGNQRGATPMLTDIEFDIDGSLILGFRSRTGDMFGYYNRQPVADPSNSNLGDVNLPLVFTDGFGDIMRVCNVGGSFVLEGGAGCPFNATVSGVSDGIYDSATNTTGEYYFGDWGPNVDNLKMFHENSLGSLAILSGKGQVLNTVFDALVYHSGGIMTHNNTTGNSENRYHIYAGQIGTNGLFSKANGLGDLEVFCNAAPLEIGNRIWTDTDADGIQDADEAGIDGIAVQLYEGSTLVGTTTTANGGQWLFNNTNVNQNGATEVKPNTAYTIRVASAAFPSGQTLTTANVGGTGQPDVRDNDASLVSGNAEIAYTTGSYGQNDHTLDMGFRTAAVCSVTVDSATPTACNPATNTYDLAVNVTYSNQPTGDITINVGGTNYPFTPDGTSPDTYTVTGLSSDGAIGIDVAATFVGDNACTNTLVDAYNAPANCACNLSVSPSGTNVSCNGGSDGTASVTASGNAGAVTYLWSNGGTTSSITGLTAGTYSVTVTETPTCTAVTSYDVTEPSALTVNCSSTDVTTNGGSDGTASVSASGGTSPYTYLWTDGETTSGISNKVASTYSVTVTDNNGCTDACTTTIQEPGCNLSVSPSGTNVSCNGGSDGTASVSASGNIAPVTYLWSNGGTTASISGLTAGTYSVTVTETPTCTAVTSYDVTEPSALTVNCSSTDVTTNGGSDGTASVSASGGTSPYTYLWNSGETTSSISNKAAATYSVTVTDNNGCTDACTTTIQEPGCNLSVSPSGTNVSCNGGSDGTASVSASGNIAPVTYLWSNGGTTASISGLTAGTYTVTVTETATCTAVTNYDVTEPSALTVNCSSTDVTTNGGSDGTASVSASGGTSPYTYLWTDGETTSSINNKTAATYSVTVTDNNGCTDACTTTIQEPGCNLSVLPSGTNVNCNGGTDGTASVIASDNIAPVSYLWSNGGTTASISGLTAGTYTVTVTETPTCTAVTSYDVTEPSALTVNCSNTDVTTNGGSDGTASVSASGGTSPYTYLWNSGETTSGISNKVAATYSVTVTDNNGCTDACTTTIQEPGCNLSVSPSGTNVSCNGGSDGTASVSASGNIAPVTYLWSNGGTTASISGLTAGTYTVTVTETATCTAVTNYDVTEPSALTVNCSSTDVTTNGGSDGTASVSASGGTSPYTYLWTDGETTSSINNKVAATYSVTVTDNNGCSDVCQRTIAEPGALPDLSLTKTVNTTTTTLNSTVIFTLTLTNDNGIDATGVVVTDNLPAGATFVSSSDPANVNVSGNVLIWNVGNMLGTDAPKTLQITVTAANEGSFVNTAEISAMNEADTDSTPNNDIAGEDDQDQACFSVPVKLCSDNTGATITITSGTASSWQWYVSTDNGATYTALNGETNQNLLVDNTLMGGNGVTKYFKVAYNGAAITDGCGATMCCPIIVTTEICTVCPMPKCIPITITKTTP